MTELSAEIEALFLAELAKRVKARTAATKAVFGAAYAPGDKQTFRSPVDETKLGTVFRSDPDPEWRVVDWAALREHLRQDQANFETSHEIADEAAAIEVLREHAPHLLAEITRVNPDVVEEALDQSRRTGTPAAPGIERVKPEGVLTVRPDRNAGVAIERMVQAGVISWDGRPVLEAGQETTETPRKAS